MWRMLGDFSPLRVFSVAKDLVNRVTPGKIEAIVVASSAVPGKGLNERLVISVALFVSLVLAVAT